MTRPRRKSEVTEKSKVNHAWRIGEVTEDAELANFNVHEFLRPVVGCHRQPGPACRSHIDAQFGSPFFPVPGTLASSDRCELMMSQVMLLKGIFSRRVQQEADWPARVPMSR